MHHTVYRFQGLERGAVSLRVGPLVLPARFEEGHSSEEKVAAVHYVRFTVPAEALVLPEGGAAARLVVDHPNYQAEAALPAGVIAELQKTFRRPEPQAP